MKLSKILTISAMATIVAFNAPLAQAESCDGGSLVTGTNGHEYCRSRDQMNWWSAYTWCEAQGRHLASMYEICPDWDGVEGRECSNTGLTDNTDLCSSTAYGAEKIFYIQGQNIVRTWNRTSIYYAICY